MWNVFYHFLSAKCQFAQLAAGQMSVRRNQVLMFVEFEFVLTVAHLTLTTDTEN